VVGNGTTSQEDTIRLPQMERYHRMVKLTHGSDADWSFVPNDDGTYVLTLEAKEGRRCNRHGNSTIEVVNVNPTANQDGPPTCEDVNVTVRYWPMTRPAGANDPLEITGRHEPSSWIGDDPSRADCLHISGYSGTDAFGYTIADGDGGVATGTVSVTIQNLWT